jgi:peroxiredoxin
MNKKGIILLAIFAAGIAAVLFLAKSGEPPKKQAAVVGLDAPIFELKDTEGRTWKLSDLKGKVVLVNFGASWCETCKEEKPYFRDIVNNQFKSDKLVYLFVPYNDDPSSAIKSMQEAGFDYPILIDTKKNVALEYGLTGVPETYIVDKKGILAKKIIGGIHWDMPGFISSVEKLINQ